MNFFLIPLGFFSSDVGNYVPPGPSAQNYIAIYPDYVNLFSTFGHKRLPEGYQDAARTCHTVLRT